MMNVLFANSYWAPLLVLIISFILVYIGLKRVVKEASDIVLVILSAIVSIMFVSSSNSVQYLFHLIPYLTTLMVVSFSIMLVLIFVAKEDMFKTYMAWTGFAIAMIVAVYLAFVYFPTLGHMLPQSSNYGLGSNAVEFKDWIYSKEIKDTFVLFLSIGLVGFFLMKK